MEKNASSVEKKLSGATVNVTHKASEKGKLYASVTEKEVIAAIKEQLKVELAESNIKMDHFKEVGEYEIKVMLPGGHTATLTVVVEGALS